MTMTSFDKTTYEPLARKFMEDVVALKLRTMARQGIITLREEGLNEKDLNLAYDQLFIDFLPLESLNGIEHDGSRYLPSLLFARIPEGLPINSGIKDADALFLTQDRTLLHGGVDDTIIQGQARQLFSEGSTN